jgi:CheY-like chemotaxis protein
VISHVPHHFLLVENDATEAKILAQAFADIPECGTVSVARNISEAKAYLLGAGVYQDRAKFRLPSTILSSYRVDGDSGVDLLAWVKGQPALRAIPFVLLTPASTSPSELEQAKRTGSVKIATKPQNPRELKAMLERLAALMCSKAPDVSF